MTKPRTISKKGRKKLSEDAERPLVTFRLNLKSLAKLEEEAKRDHRSRSSQVEWIIDKHYEELEKR